MANVHDDHELDSLLDSLQSSLAIYRAELKERGLPPLSTKSGRPTDDINYVPSPKLYEAKRIVLATLGLITNAIETPFEKLVETVFAPTQSSSLQIAVRLSVPDRIAASSDGLTIDEIAEQAKIDPVRIGSSIRLLTANGWFEEGPGGKYKNTRFSEQLKEGEHAGNWARASEVWDRIWAYQAEAVCRDDWRLSQSPLHTGTQLAHNTEKHFFDYLLEDQGRAGAFIDAINALDNSVLGAIAADYPWDKVPSGTTLVDVGGGAGSLSVAVAKKNNHLKFLVEDQAGPVSQAKLNFSKNAESDSSLTGRLDAKVQNFFEPQTGGIGGDEYSFMLKWILHDWPEAQCVQILSHLAKVAGPNSRIIIFEHLIQSGHKAVTGPSATETLSGVPSDADSGYKPIAPIPFVAPTFGKASTLPLSMSFSMNSLFNASERPLETYKKFFDQAGLELVQVYPLRSWVWAMETRKKRA